MRYGPHQRRGSHFSLRGFGSLPLRFAAFLFTPTPSSPALGDGAVDFGCDLSHRAAMLTAKLAGSRPNLMTYGPRMSDLSIDNLITGNAGTCGLSPVALCRPPAAAPAPPREPNRGRWSTYRRQSSLIKIGIKEWNWENGKSLGDIIVIFQPRPLTNDQWRSKIKYKFRASAFEMGESSIINKYLSTEQWIRYNYAMFL